MMKPVHVDYLERDQYLPASVGLLSAQERPQIQLGYLLENCERMWKIQELPQCFPVVLGTFDSIVVHRFNLQSNKIRNEIRILTQSKLYNRARLWVVCRPSEIIESTKLKNEESPSLRLM